MDLDLMQRVGDHERTRIYYFLCLLRPELQLSSNDDWNYYQKRAWLLCIRRLDYLNGSLGSLFNPYIARQ